MAQPAKDDDSMDERWLATLRLLKPGVWYCSSDYEGCEPMPEGEIQVNGHLIANLVGKGFVESVPVFEGFMTNKHRITPEGIAWLEAR